MEITEENYSLYEDFIASFEKYDTLRIERKSYRAGKSTRKTESIPGNELYWYLNDITERSDSKNGCEVFENCYRINGSQWEDMVTGKKGCDYILLRISDIG